MLVDYSDMFLGTRRDSDLAEHAAKSAPEQDQIEASWLMLKKPESVTLACDLAKKRAMEAAKNGNGGGSGRGDCFPVGLDLDHQ